MRTATSLLTPDQRSQIEAAIAAAERRTSAEFVVAVRPRSGAYERATDLAGFAIGLLIVLGVSVAWLAAAPAAPASGAWTIRTPMPLSLAATLALVAGATVAGVATAAAVPRLARPLITRAERLREVRRAGAEAFHALRVRRTEGATGVLIYVSLFERTALITADDRVASGLPPEVCAKACQAVTAALAEGRPAEGLVQAVEVCADHLAATCPARGADTDELPNRVHLLD